MTRLSAAQHHKCMATTHRLKHSTRRHSNAGYRGSVRFPIVLDLVLAVALVFVPIAQARGCPRLLSISHSFTDEPSDQGQDKPGDLPTVLPKGKKLVLKDGTFHLVRSYERLPDPGNAISPGRVRFYSVERSAWEEIPADLVDWEATRKAEVEDAERRQASIDKLKALASTQQASNLDVDSSLEVAPGVFLPDAEGLYVVQGRAVIPLGQATADLKVDKGRVLAQVLSPIPIVPSRHRIQLTGKLAILRLTPAPGEKHAYPEFYYRVFVPEESRESTTMDEEPNLELIRAQVKGNHRILELRSTYITGETEKKRNSITVERWKVARRVYRLTVQQGLEPGEYVLTETLPEGMNLYVWDFGVDSTPPPLPKNR